MEICSKIPQDLAHGLALPVVPRSQAREVVCAGVRAAEDDLQTIPLQAIQAFGVDLFESVLEALNARCVRLGIASARPGNVNACVVSSTLTCGIWSLANTVPA